MSNPDYKAAVSELFAKKRTQINNAINTVMPQVGQKVGTEVIAPLFVVIARNISDLYDINETTLKSLIDLKAEVDQLAIEVQNLDKSNTEKTYDAVKNQVNQLSSRFDKTFGSLEDIIDKIKKRDEQDGNIPGYG
jgi:hypothetical protein